MKHKIDMRYVDMAIYIDDNIHKKDHDVARVYNYLNELAYMLAIKRRLFHHEHEYDEFSHWFAALVYSRMTTPRQYLDESDPKYLTPIKSCLNYLKQTLYAKYCEFLPSIYNYTTDVDHEDYQAVKDYTQEIALTGSTDLLTFSIDTYIKDIERIIWDVVKDCTYSNDIVISKQLYTACLLSLLRGMQLSPANKAKLYDKCGSRKNNYDELISRYVAEESKTAITTYDLDGSYADYIAVLVQRIKTRIITDIQEFCAEYELPDDLIEDILYASTPTAEEDD